MSINKLPEFSDLLPAKPNDKESEAAPEDFGATQTATQENLDQQAEDVENIFDASIETLLTTHRVENAGNNGLIMRFGLNDISEDMQTMLRERGITFEEEAAVKILKVYSPEQGGKEYKILQQAYGLVANAPNREELAKVPRPMIYREIEISPETREYLNRQGARLNEKLAVIMMEHIPGKDMATHLYDFVLRNYNYAPATLEEMSFGEKQQLVAQFLRFREPGGKAPTEGEREYERMRVMADNAGTLIKYVGDNHFEVHTATIEKIRRTTQLFHKNGIWHNDLHERNVMTTNPADQYADVYIIDFGSAGDRDESKSSGEMRVSDETIVMRLKTITDSANARLRDKESLKSELLSFKDRLKSVGRWGTEYPKARELFRQNPRAFLDGRLAAGSANSTELDKLVVTLEEMLNDPLVAEDEKDEITAFIRRHRETDKRGYVRKRFSFFDDRPKKDA